MVQVGPNHGFNLRDQLSRGTETQMAEDMGDPITTRPRVRRSPGGVALRFLSRLILPTLVTGLLAALSATADTPTVVPLTCRIGGGMVGRTYIFHPVCTPDSPPSKPAPNGPPSGPVTPPGTPPTP